MYRITCDSKKDFLLECYSIDEIAAAFGLKVKPTDCGFIINNGNTEFHLQGDLFECLNLYLGVHDPIAKFRLTKIEFSAQKF